MGKIELDHTGSGGGVTLSSDGTDLLLDGTAIGGGGAALELYAENPSTPTAPSATGTNAIAIGDSATAVDTYAIAIGPQANAGSYAIALGYDANASGSSSFAGYDATASGSSSIAIGGSAVASGTSSMALGYGTDATGDTATAVGRNAQARATSANAFGRDAWSQGSQSTAIGDAYASGTDSFAAAIANNTSTYGAAGSNSVAIGQNAKATGGRAYALGRNSIASSTGSYSIGDDTTASQLYAMAYGKKAKSDVQGKHAFGTFTVESSGAIQGGLHVLYVNTTDATAVALSTSNSAASTTNQIILPNNSAFAFHGTIVARQKAGDGTASAAWKVEGLIRREGSAGTTVLVNSATTVLDNTPGWGMALSADTTNGGLKVEATGAASTNIRWVATIHTSEVTYA
jgi:hypothetical protein